MPLTDIIIVDPFVCSDNSLLEYNLLPFLSCLSNKVKTKLNIIIYTNKDTSLPYEDLSNIIRKTINNITGLLGSNHYFSDLNDVILAYDQSKIEIHTPIWVRYTNTIFRPLNIIKVINLQDESYIEYYENIQIRKDKNNKIIVQYIKTTTGRVLLNYIIQTTLKIES